MAFLWPILCSPLGERKFSLRILDYTLFYFLFRAAFPLLVALIIDIFFNFFFFKPFRQIGPCILALGIGIGNAAVKFCRFILITRIREVELLILVLIIIALAFAALEFYAQKWITSLNKMSFSLFRGGMKNMTL